MTGVREMVPHSQRAEINMPKAQSERQEVVKESASEKGQDAARSFVRALKSLEMSHAGDI